MRVGLLLAGSVAAILLALAAPDPRALAQRLESPSAREREDATRALAALGAEAAPALEEAVRSADPDVRSRASALLARVRRRPELRESTARAAALRILRDVTREGRTLAARGEDDRALAELGPFAGDVLADVARTSARSGPVRGDLVLALARHESAASLRALADLWADGSLLPSDAIRAGRLLAETPRRADAAAALARVEERFVRAPGPLRRGGVALASGFAGDGAREFLLRAALDVDAGVRAEAARALGDHLPAAAAERLRALAVDPSPDVRLAALRALRRVPGIPHPEPALVNAEDPRTDVRAAAAALLVREATPDCVAALDALATDSSVAVRAAVRDARAALLR